LDAVAKVNTVVKIAKPTMMAPPRAMPAAASVLHLWLWLCGHGEEGVLQAVDHHQPGQAVLQNVYTCV
jgi:hypothetical protein